MLQFTMSQSLFYWIRFSYNNTAKNLNTNTEVSILVLLDPFFLQSEESYP